MEGVIGEIRLWAASFEPYYWSFCDGRLLQIRSYTPLFALLGTTYGGDGKVTFALPDLRGRIPIAAGQGPGLPEYYQGDMDGTENAALMLNQLPVHNHTLRASSGAGTLASPQKAYPSGVNGRNIYAATATGVMTSTVFGPQGAAPVHNNMMPFLCSNYIICLQGYFPSRW